MLESESWTWANPAADDAPLLLIVVDTEEEFDWSRPHCRDETAVRNIAAQHRAHRILEKYGLRPTYLVDYPVASQKDGFRPLLELYRDGLCDIGAHLHPWVNPPDDEAVCNRNSYPGNLPRPLEREKLHRLTETIADHRTPRPEEELQSKAEAGKIAAILADMDERDRRRLELYHKAVVQLMALPTSWAALTRSGRTVPSSTSTSTSAICAAKP